MGLGRKTTDLYGGHHPICHQSLQYAVPMVGPLTSSGGRRSTNCPLIFFLGAAKQESVPLPPQGRTKQFSDWMRRVNPAVFPFQEELWTPTSSRGRHNSPPWKGSDPRSSSCCSGDGAPVWSEPWIRRQRPTMHPIPGSSTSPNLGWSRSLNVSLPEIAVVGWLTGRADDRLGPVVGDA